MLRILRDEVEALQVVLILQGHIVAEWAEVLERECQELSRAGKRVELDLRSVVFIGCSGFETLGRLARAGVRIIACSSLIADMLEQEGIEVGRDAGCMDEGKVSGNQGGMPDA